MAKDPAFLFYSNDFLSGTFTMSNEQIGKYIRLLCLQHQKGSLSEKDMLNICKTYDEDIYCKFETKDGKYINQRLYDEATKRRLYSESRRKNRESANSNEKIDNTDKDKNNISLSYVQHMENENENRNVIEIEDIRKEQKKKIDFDLVLHHWNSFASEVDIPQLKAISEDRKKKIRLRSEEAEFDFKEIIKQIQDSDFLLGKKGTFKVSFDWIFKSKNNYLKIIEGNYKNADKPINNKKFDLESNKRDFFNRGNRTA